MNTSRRKFFGILLTASVAVFSGCGSGSDSKENQIASDAPVIKITYNDWLPDTMVYLAQEKGFFEKYDANVELVWVADFDETFEKIETGEVGISSMPLLDYVQADSIHADWQVIWIEDFSAGADALVAMEASGLKTIEDLKGKKVGAEQGSLSEFFLNRLLQRKDMTLEDVEVVNVSADEVPQALLDGEIDAGVTYEPSVTELVAAGGLVIEDSTADPGSIVDVYIGNRAMIELYQDDYVNVLRGIIDAQTLVNSDLGLASEIIAELLEITSGEVSEGFEKLRIPDKQDNLTAFNRASGPQAVYNLMKSAQDYMQDQGLAEGDLDMDKLINTDLIDHLD